MVNNVGCIEYDDDVDEFGALVPLEQIGENNCAKFCKNTIVTFTLNDPNNNISRVRWSQNGGVTQSGTQNLDFIVQWNSTSTITDLTVDVELNNQTIITRTLCIEVIELPVADFDLLSGFNDRCAGDFQLIDLSSDTSGSNLISYEWVITNSNGNTISSSGKEPNIYLEQGDWVIELTVTNECNCSQTIGKELRVEGVSVTITCPTVTCEGTIEAYTIENANQCGSFEWNVEGGTIVSGGNSSIVEINWNQPIDGFGYIYFNQGDCNACDNIPAVAKIPIIEENGTIEGPEQLCVDEQYVFSLPRWPAVEFEWSLTDAGNSPILPVNHFRITDQPNEIALNTASLEPGEYFLNCNYDSPLLLCGGNAQHSFIIQDKLKIVAPEEVCLGDIVNISTEQLNNNTEYKIFFNNIIFYQQTISDFSYLFNIADTFTVTATSPNYCESDPFTITVHDLPRSISLNTPLEGTLEEVCPNTPYNYSLDINDDDYFLEWDIDSSDGTISGNTEAEQVTVLFEPNAGTIPYVLSARKVSKRTGCKGPWSDYDITPVSIDTNIIHFDPLNLTNTAIANKPYHCASTIIDFRVDYLEGETYEWYFTDPRLASIVSGQNTNEVAVMLNEPINQLYAVSLGVRIRKCGIVYEPSTFDIEIDLGPQFNWFPLDAEYCSGDEISLQFQPQFPQNPANVYDLSVWSYEAIINYQVGSNFIVNRNTDFTVSVGANNLVTVNNLVLPDVDSSVTANIIILTSDQNDCSAASPLPAFSGQTVINPRPQIDLIRAGDLSFCDAASIDTSLEVIHQNTAVGNVTYQWYLNSSLIAGQTASILDIIPALGFGSYYCEVNFINSNPSDCTTSTYIVEITERNCVIEPPCIIEQVEITSIVWTDCDEIQVTVNNFGNTPDLVGYRVSGAFFNTVSSTLTSATLQAGTYNLNITAVYPHCTTYTNQAFTIGYQSYMESSVTCRTNGGYDVTLIQTGSILASYPNATTVTYELPGVGSVVSTAGQHTFSNVPVGVYNARILIDGAGPDPVCIATQEITLSTPDAAFTMYDATNITAGAITQTCTECPLLLRPNNINPNHSYKWRFLTDATNTQISPEISLPVGNSQEIKLTVTDEHGCETITSQFINVTQAEFSIFYANAGVYCEGAQIDLSILNSGPDTPSNPNSTNPNESGYLWMLDTEPAPGINTNAIYNPTVSGAYWVKLRNQDLCLDDMDAVNVTVLPKPFFDIGLPDLACVDQPFLVNGLTATAGSGIMQYRWIIDGTAGAWENTFPIPVLEENYSNDGTYTYILEVEADNGCTYQVEKDVIVTPTPDIGFITVTPDSCDPYAVELRVSNAQGGTYHWSDGFTGYPHIVTRGGAYQLTFVPDNSSCTVELEVYVEKDPSSYLWYFPSGCLDYCEMEDPASRYIPGMPILFDRWDYNSSFNPINGAGAVPNYDLTNALGTNDEIRLSLENNGCEVTSEPLVLSKNEDCENCELELIIDEVFLIEEPYIYFELYGSLVNNQSFDVHVTFAAGNGNNGFFTPSSITVPANGSVNLNPLLFTPQSPFNGGNVVITMSVSNPELDCFTKTEVKFPEITVENDAENESKLSVSPNPVVEKAQFNYEIVSSEKGATYEFAIYNLNGILEHSSLLKTTSGSLNVELAQLKPSTYVVVIKNQGNVLVQTRMIKK